MYPLKGGARLNRQTSAHCSFGDSLVLEGLVLGGVGMTEPQGTWKAECHLLPGSLESQSGIEAAFPVPPSPREAGWSRQSRSGGYAAK